MNQIHSAVITGQHTGAVSGSMEPLQHHFRTRHTGSSIIQLASRLEGLGYHARAAEEKEQYPNEQGIVIQRARRAWFCKSNDQWAEMPNVHEAFPLPDLHRTI